MRWRLSMQVAKLMDFEDVGFNLGPDAGE